MSFDEIYRKYYRELYGFALQIKKSEAEAEDLVHEVFTKYFVELKKQTVFENSRAWLYKVLLNLSVSQKRSNGLHQKYVDSKMTEPAIAAGEPDFFENEKQQIVFSTLEKMDEKERQLLTLYHNGLSYNEMAEILNIKSSSVGTTLVRAIGKLKTLLKLHYYEMFE